MVSNATLFAVSQAVSAEDILNIQHFLNDHFCDESPLTVAFQLPNDPPSVRQRSLKVQSQDDEDFVIKAEDSHGGLIGVAVIQKTPLGWRNPEESIGSKNSIDFANFIKKDAHLDKLPEKNTQVWILSVHPDWRRRGVSRRLVEESMRVARSLGFKAIFVCCASQFVANLARSLGWREHYRMAYKDYPRVSGREVYVNPTPPHDHIYYYVTDL